MPLGYIDKYLFVLFDQEYAVRDPMQLSLEQRALVVIET